MSEQNPTAQPMIVCPLEFERRVLLRTGLSSRCRVMTCGPGPHAMQRWVDCAAVKDQPVILAGLAGALHERCAVRSAYRVGAVVDNDGRRWEPSLRPPDGLADKPAAVITSAPQMLTTPSAKQALGQRSGAHLVDLESTIFAETAMRSGWRWAIVRGISDGVDEALPAGIDRWVDDRGRTKVLTVVASILRRPTLIGDLQRVRANSLAAMEAVEQLICTMLD